MKKLPPFKDPGLDKVFSDSGIPMWPNRNWDKNPMTNAERQSVLEKFDSKLDRQEKTVKFLREHQLFKYQTAEEIRTMRHKRKKTTKRRKK